MKEYDLIIIGTGSAMNFADAIIRANPKVKMAVIDKDTPGGICLTRGCIPSKILLYPAELVRAVRSSRDFGIGAEIKGIDFAAVMERMRSLVGKDVEAIRRGLSDSPNIDYYPSAAEFTAPYELSVAGESITSRMIFLCAGSRAIVPPVKGLPEAGYLTSDTLLELTALPREIAIIGGGYIAAEYGHFLSCMGAKVTIIGRNPRFLHEEEPEVSALAERELGKRMRVLTNHEVTSAEVTKEGRRRLTARDVSTGTETWVDADEILVAAGRGPLTDILHPEKAGIRTTPGGWIEVDEYLQTSLPGVWAFGDATGRHLFKHAANYESEIVFLNAILKQSVKADFHAVPHAVFTEPEVASVGMLEAEAVALHGEGILIGFYRYEDTAKGEAMGVRDCFVKVVVDGGTMKILGASIIGPNASILIQEIVNAMYTPDRSIVTITTAMHIHPAMSEVVQRALGSLMPVEHYHEHILGS